MLPDDDNNGESCSSNSLSASNMLYVYRPDRPRELYYVKTVQGARHNFKLFLHDFCTGNRASYTAKHVNQLLTDKDNPERIKERIVELIPHLSEQQKKWLADGISSEALNVIKTIDDNIAQMIDGIKADQPIIVDKGNRGL